MILITRGKIAPIIHEKFPLDRQPPITHTESINTKARNARHNAKCGILSLTFRSSEWETTAINERDNEKNAPAIA